MLCTYNQNEMRLNFECLSPSFLYSSRLFACLHVWEYMQKGVDFVCCKYFTDHVVLSQGLLAIQKQQIMKYQWGRQNEESRRGVKKAIQTLLPFSCQLYKN